MRVLYFLEDRAQDGFIKAIVERVAKEVGIHRDSLVHDVRSARHGSQVFNRFKAFLEDPFTVTGSQVDLLVVAIDGNCKGHHEVVKRLEDSIPVDSPLRDRIVYAVPDPHIERWYLLDQRALKKGVGLDHPPDLPDYKCEKDFYKQLLNQTLAESDVNSLLGGAEYAEQIVAQIQDLDAIGSLDDSFSYFVHALKKFFKTQQRLI